MKSRIIRAFALALIIWSNPIAADNGKYNRVSPPRGSIVVDATGSYQDSHPSISAAVTSLLNTTSTSPQTIFILPGTYTEQVYVPKLPFPLTVQGSTPDARTYKSNTVTIAYNLSRKTPNLPNNDATSTVRLWSPNVRVYNLNILNTFGAGSQALALSAQASNQGFYGCRFEGWQDTVYANEGSQIYANSYISGAVDFIFGLRARAWFHDIDIDVLGAGFITANGREATNNTSIYVINQSNIFGSSGAGSTVLGRPWRQFSRVVVQKSYLGDVVKKVGWEPWDAVQPTENIEYGEYKNFGPGAGVEWRAEFAEELERPYKKENLFGKGFQREFWVDENYL